jgi:plasmid stabilization system protein ParE
MSLRVVVLSGAEGDLRELRAYVGRRFGAKTWANTVAALRTAFERIGTHPETGRVPEELAALAFVQYRQVVVGKNRVIYEVRGSIAFIHLVCDSRRDLKAVLLRRLVEP